jgi:hypothetical protein
LGFAFCSTGFALSAAIRDATSSGLKRVFSDDFGSGAGQFVLNLLLVLGTNLDEGVNRADCHVEADASDDVRAGFAEEGEELLVRRLHP